MDMLDHLQDARAELKNFDDLSQRIQEAEAKVKTKDKEHTLVAADHLLVVVELETAQWQHVAASANRH